MAADSRTHSGIDNISAYPKLFDFSVPGERVLVICTSGSLSLTQGVITRLRRDLHNHASPSLHACTTLYDIASYVGDTIRQVHEHDRAWLKKDGIEFSCRFLVGGQTQHGELELYMIYNQGNFIQATSETPFLQIGETKYGKPILDCALTYETPLAIAAKAALLSIHSTMRSNLSVGPPVHLILYEANTLVIQQRLRLDLGDPYLLQMSRLWETTLKNAAEQLPDIIWPSALLAQHRDGHSARVIPTTTTFDPKSLKLQADEGVEPSAF